MNAQDILNFANQCLTLVLILSLPPIIVATAAGLVVALLQAVTQVQEQTLPFAIKLIAVVGAIFMTSRWLGMELFRYTSQLLDQLPQM